ncbi:replication protein C, IncQ-type [Derxia lacustris]|uniref:replication protein C, IncQ-type n=1 Tax=Derxia lacustris TaxID=764842 RepID=UPI00111C613A|nr:replication protein C, IncQ-type [Derxia lacustris]
MTPELIAYCPPALLACPVFQPLQRGNRPPSSSMCTRGEKQYLWTASQALGISDQTVLLALLAIARMQMQSIPYLFQRVSSDVTEAQFCATLDEVALHARIARGGSGGATIAGALQRLAGLRLKVIKGDETTHPFLHYTYTRGKQGRVGFSLCPLAHRALVGREYAAVNLEERFSFRTELGRALHASLSQAVSPGKAVLFKTSTLLARLYSNAESTDSTTRRFRQLDVELEKLARLPGWHIVQEGDLRQIARRRVVVTKSEMAQRQGVDGIRHNEQPHAALPMPADPHKSCRSLGEELLALFTTN